MGQDQAAVATPIIVEHSGVTFILGNLDELAALAPLQEGKLKDSLFLAVAKDLVVPCYEKLPATIVPQERLLLVFKAISKAYRNGKRDEPLENALGGLFIRENMATFARLMEA